MKQFKKSFMFSLTLIALMISSLGTTPVFASIVSTSFAAKMDFGAGDFPYDIAIGDLDGDGKSDLVVANITSRTISVLRNTSASGTVSYADKVDFATGNEPRHVAIGDLDGDGKPDIAVTNYWINIVSVFRNTSTSGTISFAAKVDFATGTFPESVAIGDLDTDGKRELVVVNYGVGTVSVFPNTSTSGTISFAAKVDFSTGTGPMDAAIGDLNGDGKPELVVTHMLLSDSVSVLRNTSTSGTISFADKVDFITGSKPYGVAIGDLNGDGKPDLAVVNWVGSTVSVFQNTSTSGAISFADKVNFATGGNFSKVAIGDLDGDGKPDLSMANGSSNTVSVFRNFSMSGTIFLASKVDFATGTSPYYVAVGDMDGDGKPELIVANRDSDNVSVLRNTSSTTTSDSQLFLPLILR